MLRSRLGFNTLLKLRYPAHTRSFTGASSTIRSRWTRRTVAGATMLTASSVILASTIYADSDELTPNPTMGSLFRTYLVYSLCSIPSLVDASPKLLSAMSSVPVLKQITEAFVRVTFFDQVSYHASYLDFDDLTRPSSSGQTLLKKPSLSSVPSAQATKAFCSHILSRSTRTRQPVPLFLLPLLTTPLAHLFLTFPQPTIPFHMNILSMRRCIALT